MDNTTVRYGFAGNRQISVEVLEFLISEGYQPEILLITGERGDPSGNQLISRCPFLDKSRIIRGKEISQDSTIGILRSLNLDYLICIHYPFIIPESVLAIPSEGVINLHPAYLPYNRGWHTPTWAIFENTPYGATLHFMNTSLDKGDIIHQKRLIISHGDTANTLYKKALSLEIEIFREIWPSLAEKKYSRTSQTQLAGTMHRKKDLSTIQEIKMDELTTPRKFLTKLRALTTNRTDESAYFEEDGKKYHVCVSIIEGARE